MSFQFSQKLESISSKTDQFGFETEANMANISKLRGRNISIPEAEKLHNRILGIFQSAMDDISALKLEIHFKTTPSNQDEMFGIVSFVTGYETRLSKNLTTFNDTILTFCPTAKIFYGNPCIGDKIAPKIDTSDQKILEMLAHSASIREIRGDGNCFLSAFTTRFLENLVKKQEIERFINFMTEDGINAPEVKEELISTLLYLQEYPSQLENILKDNHRILPFINYFRQLTASEMKEHKADFEVFFLPEMEQTYNVSIKGKSYENLVDEYVLKMGVDFCHPMITALCRKLDFPVCIIDPKIGAPEGVNVLEWKYAYGTFCRNGAHYFVLYTHEESAPIPVMPIQQPQIIIPASMNTDILNTLPVRTTLIEVKCDVGFGNRLFIRGNGPGLSWDKGVELRNVSGDTWVYETQANFENFEYKILKNDLDWEGGDNHKAGYGKKEDIVLTF